MKIHTGGREGEAKRGLIHQDGTEKHNYVSSCHTACLFAGSVPYIQVRKKILTQGMSQVLQSTHCKMSCSFVVAKLPHIFFGSYLRPLYLSGSQMCHHIMEIHRSIFLAQRKTVHLFNKCVWNSCHERSSNWEYK